jgi:hypothetical protein
MGVMVVDGNANVMLLVVVIVVVVVVVVVVGFLLFGGTVSRLWTGLVVEQFKAIRRVVVEASGGLVDD